MGGLADAAGQVGQATGISNVAQGIADLFTGGGGAPEAGAAGAPASLDFMGPPTPGAAGAITPEMVGPPSPYQTPNFMQGFVQGFTGGTPGAGADVPMGAGGEVGGGLGQLMHAIQQLRSGGASGLVGDAAVPIAGAIGRKLRGPEMAPGYQQASAPQGGLIHKIIAAYTGGILDSPKMGGL